MSGHRNSAADTSGFRTATKAFIFYSVCGKRAFTGSFDHAKVAWVRKTAVPPLYLAECFFLTITLLIASYICRITNLLFLKSPLMQSSFVYSQYLSSAIAVSELRLLLEKRQADVLPIVGLKSTA